MNKHEHIDLKPHIDSLCDFLGTTKEELKNIVNNRKPDLKRRFMFSYLYYNLGSTYKNIANEFGVKVPSVYNMIQKANESLKDGCPLHLEFERKMKEYYALKASI
jgi:DNA-binding transcriptional regulator LsrR (DeoR family)